MEKQIAKIATFILVINRVIKTVTQNISQNMFGNILKRIGKNSRIPAVCNPLFSFRRSVQLLTTVLFLLVNLSLSAQSFEQLYNENKGMRDKHSNDREDRKVKLGVFAEYYLSPSAKIISENAFLGGFGGGLRLLIPIYTTGNGTNGGDNTGDLTISTGYTSWLGSNNNSSNSFPDLNAYSGLAGFRVGMLDIFYVEPQVGYSYGTYSNTYYKYAPSQASGITWAFHAGCSMLHGFDVYAKLQSTKTKAFGSPIDYGAGMAIHF